jgi:MSHA biogenesis protein MshP
MKPISTMCLDVNRHRRKVSSARESGVAIMAAIFLLVTLSALGAFMLNFTNVQQSSSALDIEGTRAYWAAKSGLDWGMYQVYQNAANTCACANGCTGGGAGSNTSSITVGNFTATVACTCTSVCEEGASRSIYKYSVNACNQPTGGTCPNGSPTSGNYVNRQVFGTVVN